MFQLATLLRLLCHQQLQYDLHQVLSSCQPTRVVKRRDVLSLFGTTWAGIAQLATRCGLVGSPLESMWGARFSASVQTGPEVNPATVQWVLGSFPGGKAAVAWR